MAPFTNPVLQSFLSVAVPLAVLVLIVHSGLFDSIKVETGYDHYAEPADSKLGPIPFPSCIKMPANALVNIGYMLVAMYWGIYIFISNNQLTSIQNMDAYLMYVLVWMMFLYAPVQFARIITQKQEWAILDQWVTLPIFAWVMVTCKTLLTDWQPKFVVLTILASLMSYNLVFTMEQGFDIALLPHIVYAVSASWDLCSKYTPPGYRRDFGMAVLMCAGFVVLKVCDFHLAQFWIFQELTGHFWSKVCDALQAHFALQVLFKVSLIRGARNLAKKLF
ncbi:transmembrane protein 187-like [Lytechinus variegatus]|uniref:transmembrane protein 187-like n=1 Tax=Lytechinus variegatus TaxID=7654 RepID=UPI001BB25F12|nr:transmembrane protein 187-like [Lytechinus variegatus]